MWPTPARLRPGADRPRATAKCRSRQRWSKLRHRPRIFGRHLRAASTDSDTSRDGDHSRYWSRVKGHVSQMAKSGGETRDRWEELAVAAVQEGRSGSGHVAMDQIPTKMRCDAVQEAARSV